MMMSSKIPDHTRVYQACLPYLRSSLQLDDVLVALSSYGVVSTRTYEQIKRRMANDGPTAACELFVTEVLLRDPDPEHFLMFVSELDRTKQVAVSRRLREEYKNIVGVELDVEVAKRRKFFQQINPDRPPTREVKAVPVSDPLEGQQKRSFPGNDFHLESMDLAIAAHPRNVNVQRKQAVPSQSQLEPLPDIQPLDRNVIKLDRNACVGRGNFGYVYKCDLSGTVVAVKELGIPKKRKAELTESLENEIRVSATVRHPNIIQFMGYCFDNQPTPCLLLVYEFIDGNDLDDILCDDDLTQEYDFHVLAKRYRILMQVSQALAYLHGQDRKIIHGDIKPANVMVTRLGDAKLCDLGLSKIKRNNAATLATTAAARGTPMYMAPEQLLDNKTSSTKSDMYAFGALIYEVLFENYIWDIEEDLDDYGKLLEKMRNERIPQRLQEIAGHPAYDIIKQCVQFDHANRLDALSAVGYLKSLYESAGNKKA